METIEKWTLFKNATEGEPQNISFDTMNTTFSYIDLFTKEIPLPPLEKKTLSHIIAHLLENNYTVADTVHFLPFVLPIEQIEKGILHNEQIIPSLNELTTPKIKETILAALATNEIPKSVINFMLKNPHSREKHFFVLAFSYLMTENIDLFPASRATLFDEFRQDFQTKSVPIPLSFFVTDDMALLTTYRKIEAAIKTNELLRLALLLASKTTNESLAQFIEEIKSTYTELCTLLANLKTHMTQLTEVTHA